jgi:hypothetical protein
MNWKVLLTALSALLLVGCATPQRSGEFAAPAKKVVSITWEARADAGQHCARLMGHFASPASATMFVGCANWDDAGNCRIITPLHLSHELLGHEVRHCFMGDFH